MTETSKPALRPPRIELGRPLLIAGLGGNFTFDTLGGLPALWQRFRPHLGTVPGQVGNVTHGVCYNTNDDTGRFDYIAGVEVTGAAPIPNDFATVRLTERRRAIFTHEAHISAIRGTFTAIFNDWLRNFRLQERQCPAVRALRRTVRPARRHGRFRDLDPHRNLTGPSNPRPKSAKS